MRRNRARLLLLAATTTLLGSCRPDAEPATESLVRLPFAGASARVTRLGDTRLAETVTPRHARRLCLPSGSGGDAGTLRVALASVGPAEAAVRASLVGADDAVPDVPIGDAWSTLRVAIGRGECAELTVTGDASTRVAIARPIVSRPGTRRPWVIFYVFDTLRFDQLVGEDGALRAIPAFEALARDALLFERAFSNSSWTRPSVASLLTGVGPSAHGVYDFSDRIRSDVPSLATQLADAGYRTVALSTNPNVLPAWNFDVGFDQFVDLKGEKGFRGLYHSLETAGRAVVTETTDEPLFLLIHDNGPHAPYWTPPGYEPPLPPLPHPETSKPHTPLAWRRYGQSVQFSSTRLDALVGRLREIGRYEDAVIAVLGDHGESFGEDGYGGHATALSGVQIHVPVLLKAPRARGLVGRVSTPISLADIAPTVLALLDLPGPEAWHGRALPLDASAKTPPNGDVVSELDTPWGTAGALIRWPWKYVRRGNAQTLFDLARDPGETDDVAGRHPEIVADLRSALASERRPAADEVVFECVAGTSDARVDVTLFLGAHDPPVEFHSNNLEATDRTEPLGAALELTLDLPYRAEQRGAGAFGRDRDLVRVTGMTRERIRVRLEMRRGEPALVGPRGEPLRADARTITLADVTTAGHVGRLAHGTDPRCRLYRTTTAAEGPVEPIPPDVEQRLRALGYL